MIKTRFKLLTMLLVLSLVFFLSACDDAPPVKKKEKPSIVKKKIVQPSAPASKSEMSENAVEPKTPSGTMKPAVEKALAEPGTVAKKEDSMASNDMVDKTSKDLVLSGLDLGQTTQHYDSQGKIDPFKPLIQEEAEKTPTEKDNKPKRILTPLEKIALSQIRLVAVIQMKNRKIAMVEEASGKGYEVTIGTYIGKNEGRITEIKSDRIIIKELVKDFRGRLKEQEQEIKLNKNSNEE